MTTQAKRFLINAAKRQLNNINKRIAKGETHLTQERNIALNQLSDFSQGKFGQVYVSITLA